MEIKQKAAIGAFFRVAMFKFFIFEVGKRGMPAPVGKIKVFPDAPWIGIIVP